MEEIIRDEAGFRAIGYSKGCARSIIEYFPSDTW